MLGVSLLISVAISKDALIVIVDGVAEEKHDDQPFDTHPCIANSTKTFRPCRCMDSIML